MNKQTGANEKLKSVVIYSVLTLLFFGGLILTYFEVLIYRKTIVGWFLPTSAYLLSGLIMAMITSRLLSKYYDTRGFFMRFIFNTVAFGGIIVYLFMALNFYLPEKQENKLNVTIIKTGELAKGRKSHCGQPYADVSVNGHIKELIFPCGYDLTNSKRVSLTIKKGFLGLDIITERQLLD